MSIPALWGEGDFQELGKCPLFDLLKVIFGAIMVPAICHLEY